MKRTKFALGNKVAKDQTTLLIGKGNFFAQGHDLKVWCLRSPQELEILGDPDEKESR